MLRNEVYIGNMIQGKFASESYKTKKNRPQGKDKWYIVENTHCPIISRDIWDKVQEKLSSKRRKSHSSRAESKSYL